MAASITVNLPDQAYQERLRALATGALLTLIPSRGVPKRHDDSTAPDQRAERL